MPGPFRRALLFALAAVSCVALAFVAPAFSETITSEDETQPYPGVRLLERHTSGPSWRIYAAFVDLCGDRVHVAARSSQSVRLSAGAWGSAMGAQLAVNGDFYRTDRSAPTVYGDAVGVGMRWPVDRTGLASQFEDDWYHRKYGWIAFGDGWVEFTHSEWAKNHAGDLGLTQGWFPEEMTTEIPAGTQALVSGFPELVVEGQALSNFPDRGDMSERHPRTAMGLTRDRKTFMLVVVDGRGTSVGMNGAELAALMKELGAWTAFNLDGGGSSQMWLSGSGYVNDPSDGSPRPVANHWGIFAGDGHGYGDEPGSCFVAGGCFPSPIPAAVSSRFADMAESAERFSFATRVVDEGLLSTCAEAPSPMFCPSCSLTRRDALVMFMRAAELDLSSPPPSPTFADVPPDAPGYAAIERAAALGVTSGCGDGNFCPDRPVTRAELAAFLARVRGWKGAPESASIYADVSADHALRGEIGALADHCVEAGCKEGEFCPTSSVRRALGAELAVKGFNLDGSNPCADQDSGGGGGGGGPGGDGDGDGEPGMGGGCRAGGPSGAGAAMMILLLLTLLRRRHPLRRDPW